MQVVYKDMTRDRAKSNVAKWNFVTEWNGMTFYLTQPPNNLHSIKYHENNAQSSIRSYPIIALHEQ